MVVIFGNSSFHHILLVLEFVVYVFLQLLSVFMAPERIIKPINLTTNEGNLPVLIIWLKLCYKYIG